MFVVKIQNFFLKNATRKLNSFYAASFANNTFALCFKVVIALCAKSMYEKFETRDLQLHNSNFPRLNLMLLLFVDATLPL